MIEKSEVVSIISTTLLHCIYGTDKAKEQYHCSFGLNEQYLASFESDTFKFSAFDNSGHVRAFEICNHPFFIATSYQPERMAFQNILHPIVDHFVLAAIKRSSINS
ncbi:CTP synthase [Acinetobacter rathckeae]|uniref:hypothetical protein n=1 Tax=Acinetobacter rathckeae TaxID=2605272 RepID=UPI0018A330C0|nr:hypothetical protein [Acinetobacter rathckeae]MBF7688643.1 hypothetical protein [Acinetobacter rathckeae]MBF7695889.1 hypothetical protein [Acinetobacter rathckeae]